MMTWGHVIWIFFPIPVFCLIMLSLPSYRSIERAGTNLVGKIFFTRVSVGPLHISLYSVFIFASFIIFTVAFKSISHGFGSAHVPCSGTSCPFHSGETMWYRRASRYRAERNFWLSLFTLLLWLLVYNIYSLKEKIIKLRSDLETISAISSEGDRQENGGHKKRN